MEVENGGNEATVTYGEKLYTYIYILQIQIVLGKYLC